MASKFVGNDQLRNGIFDLLQKVRQKGKTVTSNLPSENFSLGIGSKRLAGTGRTAGIKVKKLEQMGIANSAAQAQSYLVGGGNAARASGDEDLMFLKNAMGQEVQFKVERGGGARAQLLATRRRRLRKLMDAAASRVGASLPLYMRVEEDAKERKRKQKEQEEAEKSGKAKKKVKVGETLEFLKDNIGRGESSAFDADDNDTPSIDDEDDGEGYDGDDNSNPTELILADDTEEMRLLGEESRRAVFQAQYKLQMERQAQILKIEENTGVDGSPLRRMSGGGAMVGARAGSSSSISSNFVTDVDDEKSVLWEDCDDA
jgi:hypothetical protein